MAATSYPNFTDELQLFEERMFPIQDGDNVLWSEAEKAYSTYTRLFGNSQSLERLAERGGFGKREFELLYQGKNPLHPS